MNADLADLNAFLAVARARGFREAARRLEMALGVRLLHRTTRSVTPTEAGARLLELLAPALGEVAAALATVNELHEGVSGTVGRWHRRRDRPRRRRSHRRLRRSPSVRGLVAAAPRRRFTGAGAGGWWQPFSGLFLYHPSRRLVPPPLRAFIDYIRTS